MKRPARLYRLRISLDHIAPPIWREVLVPSNVSLRRLHGVIQRAMGWTNSHLHGFMIDGRMLGRPDPDGGEYTEDDARYRLDEMLIAPGQSMQYEYDFGDTWRHTILLEEVVAREGEPQAVRCLGGARACPPEDCGGVMGYQDFLHAIRDPTHPEHRAMLEWVGGRFDPEAFDLEAANRRLARRAYRLETPHFE